MSFDKITVHCSATQNDPKYTVQSIRDMHTARGWSDIGYHFVITSDGTLHEGRPISRTGAHVKGHNTGNLGICMIGGVDKNGKAEDNFSKDQMDCLGMVVYLMSQLYAVPMENVKGHRDYSPDLNGDGEITSNEFIKQCPCFSVKEWLADSVASW